MKKEKIAKIIYERLDYMYCDNCRYGLEIGQEDSSWGCDDCHRKYNGWGISKNESEKIADIILKEEENS